MKTLRNIILATSILAATLATPFALAHASLKNSNPVAGASLAVAPTEIALTFNEKVEEAFSTIVLADGEGKTVGANKAKVDAANPAVLRLAVPTLNAGAYTVSWAVAGHDGHRRKGDFKFSVK
ncbi:copper resistance CopC family protein [Janthinobacterium sp. HLX7-2]|uniref:copper resistance CopC family protein n=1 Tax=Janthinobacterium sp. HLX7-2 TaxID=1259331 RepID=UPI003F24C0B1